MGVRELEGKTRVHHTVSCGSQNGGTTTVPPECVRSALVGWPPESCFSSPDNSCFMRKLWLREEERPRMSIIPALCPGHWTSESESQLWSQGGLMIWARRGVESVSSWWSPVATVWLQSRGHEHVTHLVRRSSGVQGWNQSSPVTLTASPTSSPLSPLQGQQCGYVAIAMWGPTQG